MGRSTRRSECSGSSAPLPKDGKLRRLHVCKGVTQQFGRSRAATNTALQLDALLCSTHWTAASWEQATSSRIFSARRHREL